MVDFLCVVAINIIILKDNDIFLEKAICQSTYIYIYICLIIPKKIKEIISINYIFKVAISKQN